MTHCSVDQFSDACVIGVRKSDNDEGKSSKMESGERLLTILRTLNEIGPSTVLELHRATNISRPAIYRAIRTLCRYGYLKRLAKPTRFGVTSEVRMLSAGYRGDDWIGEVGAPAISRLQEKVLWPTSLTTFDKGAMVITETTRSRSPFVFDSGGVGLRLPILHTSQGLAYLAFCSRDKRRIILDLLRNSTDPLDALARDERETERLLRTTLRRGYGLRRGGIVTQTSSIAVPLLVEDDAVGAICVTFASSAVPVKEAVTKFLPQLREAARQIAASASRHASSKKMGGLER